MGWKDVGGDRGEGVRRYEDNSSGSSWTAVCQVFSSL